jgi:hypothetical protein
MAENNKNGYAGSSSKASETLDNRPVFAKIG